MEDSARVVLVSIITIGSVGTAEGSRDLSEEVAGSRWKVQGLKRAINGITEGCRSELGLTLLLEVPVVLLEISVTLLEVVELGIVALELVVAELVLTSRSESVLVVLLETVLVLEGVGVKSVLVLLE